MISVINLTIVKQVLRILLCFKIKIMVKKVSVITKITKITKITV